MTKFANELFTDLMREHGPALERLDRLPVPEAPAPVSVRRRQPHRAAGEPGPPRRRSPWVAPVAAAAGVTLAVGLAAVLGSRIHLGSSSGRAADGRAETAYVFNGYRGTMTPISPVTGRPGKPVVVGPGTHWVKMGQRRVRVPRIVLDFVLPDGTTNFALYVTGHGQRGAVAAVRRTSLVTGAAGQPIQLGRGVGQMVVTPDGKTAYVTYGGYGGRGTAGDSAVRPVSLVTGAVGAPILHGPGTRSLEITPDGRTLYVVSSTSGTVTPVSTATNRPGRPIRVPGVDQLQLTPSGRTAFAIGLNGRRDTTVTPISTATNTPGRTITIGVGFPQMVFAPDARTVYIISSGNSVTPVSLRTGRAGKPIKLHGAGNMAITPDSRTGYAVNVIYSRVTPISFVTNTVGKRLNVTGWPLYIVMAPDGRTAYAYSNEVNGQQVVVPISTATNTPGKPIRITAPSISVELPGDLDGS